MLDCSGFCKNIMRKKDLSADMMRRELRRVLTLSDLTFLAIGSMVGSGLYVLTGAVAHNTAGPSIVISYVIAAIASGFSAICYAEFAARIPITGSAYQFTYLCIGELWAFFVGWSVFFEHAVAAAAVARAWSGYVDGIFGHPIKAYLMKHTPMPGGLLATYPDFLAGALIILLTVVVAFGVKISSKFNIFFASLNLCVIIFIFCTGMYLARIEYWTAKGAFFPYGWSGTISGASTLIFSYVGYEVIASATEEAVRPKRDVPLSLFIALFLVVLAYVGASASLTLMVPWQNISVSSPFPSAYAFRGWSWAQYIVSIGALAAMTAALTATMIVVPRYLYAMARDGLLMIQCGKVNEKSGVPVVATVICGVMCFILTLLFGLITLVEFIAIGQLIANTFVAICVVKLRYEPNCVASYETLTDDPVSTEAQNGSPPIEASASTSDIQLQSMATGSNQGTNLTDGNSSKNYESTADSESVSTVKNEFSSQENCGLVRTSLLHSRFAFLFQSMTDYSPGKIPFYALLTATGAVTIVIIMCLFGGSYFTYQWWYIILLTIFIAITVLSLLLITAFNQDCNITSFKVPLVPFIPFISIIINIILILKLQPLTWVRFAIWTVVGFFIYGIYGYHFSKARPAMD